MMFDEIEDFHRWICLNILIVDLSKLRSCLFITQSQTVQTHDGLILF
jgi:hypothetical protein